MKKDCQNSCESYVWSKNDSLLLGIRVDISNRPTNGHQQPFEFMVIVRLSCCSIQYYSVVDKKNQSMHTINSLR